MPTPLSKGSRAPVLLLRLSRALTGATVLRVQRQLTAALHGRPPRVVLDLSAVHDCDAVGATLLYAFASVAADRGGEVRLADVRTPILATLADGGLFDIAAAFTTVAGAHAGDRTGQVAGQPDQRPAWTAASTQPKVAARAGRGRSPVVPGAGDPDPLPAVLGGPAAPGR